MENGFNDTTVIKKNDSAFPDHLEFAFLREQTLTHLGQFSGKLWTDHNVHDPGITILEVLIYALLDLGYRVQLPIEDLMARQQANLGLEDNFFTPNQIFTNNPTTVIDYRKMLMDIEGVRNAWLEIVERLEEGEGAELYLASDANGNFSLNSDGQGRKINLNGLYRVHLQMDKDEPYSRTGDTELIEEKLIAEAKKRLASHRNLGEDFASINVYCEEEIGIEVDLEIEESVDPEALYLEILLELDKFFSPRISSYTLQELLDKGKNIEGIYEGRPYTLQSYGFIDTEELEKVKLPGTIYLSDIYHLLLNLKGVRTARNLRLKSYVNGVEKTIKANTEDCPDMIHCVQKNCAPVFCVDLSRISLRNRNDTFKINRSREKVLLREKLSDSKKTLYKNGNKLDRKLENGTYRADLSDYPSIQNDFPNLYQVGEGQMPVDASNLRKAQVLQLKGYLLFFDQLLASYLKQLSHMRDLFSLRPDSQRSEEVRHTYFAQDLQTVPGIEKLLRFYNQQNGSSAYSEGSTLAIPVDRHTYENGIKPAVEQDPDHPLVLPIKKFETTYQRNTAKEQFRREFLQNQYQVEVLKDKRGYFFVLQTAFNDVVLIGSKRYASEQEAMIEADSIAYFGSLDQNYREINHFVAPNVSIQSDATEEEPETTYFSFELIFHQVDYLTFLQELVEDKDSYEKRRNDFLDHLLARFAFSFTDYSLLLYKKSGEQGPTKDQLIEYKGHLLSNMDHLSRNRGRAFNYCHFSWNTNNVSGFENQLAALSGISDFKRQNLCNFEIVGDNEFGLLLRDYRNRVLFATKQTYPSPSAARSALPGLTASLRNYGNYRLAMTADHQYGFYVENGDLMAFHPQVFPNAEQRDQRFKVITSLFCNGTYDGNVFGADQLYTLQLTSPTGGILKKGAKAYSTEKAAWGQLASFIEEANEESLTNLESSRGSTFKLVQNPWTKHRLLDGGILQNYYRSGIPFYRCEWGNALLFEGKVFPSPVAATQALIDFAVNDTGSNIKNAPKTFVEEWIKKSKKAYSWQIINEENQLLLQSQHSYPSKKKAEQAWREAVELGMNSANFEAAETADGGENIELIDELGRVVASISLSDNQESEVWLEEILKYWGKKKQVNFSLEKEAFAFRIPAASSHGKSLLESNAFYRSRAEALLALQQTFELAKEPRSYFNSGDEANLNYSFSLRDLDGQFVATHPDNYDTPAACAKALKAILAFCEEFTFPFQIQEVYTFQFIDENRSVLLESTQVFLSQEQAKAAFLNVLHLIGDPEYSGIKQLGGESYQLQVHDAGQVLAMQPQALPEKEKVQVMWEGIKTVVDEHRFEVSLATKPKNWKFLFWWENKQQKVEPLFVSASTYQEKEDAVRAYQNVFNHFSDLTLEKTDFDDGQFGFQFNMPDSLEPVAIHSARYSNPSERDDASEEAASLTRFVGNIQQPPQGNTSAFDENISTPVSGSTTSGFSYRILKRDKPLGFHPCKCYENSETELNQLVEKVNSLCGPARYFMICLAGDIICKVEDKYHYQIKGREDGVVYFVSFAGYATEAEAKAAFEAEYLQVIHLASNVDNYCNPTTGTNETPGNSCTGKISTVENYDSLVETCADGGVPLVVIPGAATDPTFDPSGFVNKFCAFPIRLVEDQRDQQKSLVPVYRYFFRILEWNQGWIEKKEKWRSYCWYDDLEQAWKDFRLFVYLLKDKVNYRSVFDMEGYLNCWKDGKLADRENLLNGCCEGPCNESSLSPKKCCHYIAIVEVLAKSTIQYQSEAQAWGAEVYELENGDYVYYEEGDGPVSFSTFEEACKKVDEIGFIVDPTANPLKYRYVIEGENCCFFIIESRRLTWENAATDDYTGELDLRPCEQFLSCAERFNNKTGLEEFLKFGSDRRNYFIKNVANIAAGSRRQTTRPSADPAENVVSTVPNSCLSFVVVNDQYQVARHPYHYTTQEELEAVKAQLQSCTWPDQTYLRIDTAKEGNEFHFVYKKATGRGEGYLWKSFRAFPSVSNEAEARKAALAAGKKQLLEVMEYARERRFYIWEEDRGKGRLNLCKRGDFPQEMSASNKVKLCREEGSLLVYYDFPDAPGDSVESSIEEQVNLARWYPFVQGEEGIKFQLYCENFPTGTRDDTEACKPCGTTDSTNSNPVSGTSEIMGGVIWESYNTYSTLEEAQCHFHNFEQLYKNRWRCLTTADDRCQSYSFLFVNEEGIIAEHPQCYELKVELEAAIERTIACVNMEGFHLVEHLLLRPGFAWEKPEDPDGEVPAAEDECLFNVYPDAHCCLPLETEQETSAQVCLSVPETAGNPKENGFAGRLEAEEACLKCDFSVVISVDLQTRISENMEVPEKTDVSAGDSTDFVGMHLLVNEKGTVVQKLEYEPRRENDQSPKFTVTSEGLYYIHGLVFDKSGTLVIVEGTTKLEDIIGVLKQGGGNIAGDLDIRGVSFEVGLCKDHYTPGADPYSFWTTLVLPDWTERYREVGFRDGFQHLVHRLAPAHLGINIRWVQPRELFEFENLYKLWLYSLLHHCKTGSNETEVGCPQENVGCNFVELLSNLNVCARITEDEVTGQVAAGSMTLSDLTQQGVASLFSGRVRQVGFPDRVVAGLGANSNARLWLNRLQVSSGSLKKDSDSATTSQTGPATVQNKSTATTDFSMIPEPEAATTSPSVDSRTEPATDKRKKTSTKKGKGKKTGSSTKKDAGSQKRASDPGVPETPLSRKEIRRRMRKRMSHYTAVVKARADVNMRKSKMYERALDFLGSKGTPVLYQELMEYIIKHGLNRKNADTDRFQMLVENATWYTLDNLVMINAAEVQEEKLLSATIDSLKEYGIDFRTIADKWNEAELQTWMDVPVVDNYLKMIK